MILLWILAIFGLLVLFGTFFFMLFCLWVAYQVGAGALEVILEPSPPRRRASGVTNYSGVSTHSSQENKS